MNDTQKKEQLKNIMDRARLDHKGDYSVYHSYRRMIEDIGLEPKEFEKAIRKLLNVLKV